VKRLLTIWVISIICAFMIGCSNNEVEKKEEDSIKISIEDSLSVAKEKIYNACLSIKKEEDFKTMEESIEYVKSVLPDGVTEIENTYIKEKGATHIKYALEDITFYVYYLHPYQPEPNNVDNYNLESISAITFPRIEIDSNWTS